MVGKHVRVFQREHIRVTPMDVHVVMRLAYYNRYNQKLNIANLCWKK